ncbi:thioredoxin family protein [Ferroglobus sp.]|uniref:thioredoxin family protein n=1 Tax=Ferroglobus sp. TaxID=2614230 RepID=UPI0025C048F4|nr:thioredoxin family protein [Ferroglobus sp.]
MKGKRPLPIFAMILILFGVATIILGVDEYEKYPIKFYSLEKGFKVAKKEDKPVLVYIHSDTCYVCRAFLEDLSKYEDLQKTFEKFVVVKIDFLTERALAMKFGATGTPEFHIFYPNGTPMKMNGVRAVYIGYAGSPDDERVRKSLIAFLEGALRQYKSNR